MDKHICKVLQNNNKTQYKIKCILKGKKVPFQHFLEMQKRQIQNLWIFLFQGLFWGLHL